MANGLLHFLTPLAELSEVGWYACIGPSHDLQAVGSSFSDAVEPRYRHPILETARNLGNRVKELEGWDFTCVALIDQDGGCTLHFEDPPEPVRDDEFGSW